MDVVRAMVDEHELEDVVARTAAGNDQAWQQLWAAVEGPLLRIVAQPRFLGRLGQREDDRRNIVVAVMERLRADSFARLHQYLDARRSNPRLRFLSWLRVVAKRVGIDYMRAHPDYVRRHDAGASRPGAWIDPETLPPPSQIAGERPPVTNQGTARELLTYAAGVVSPEARQVLELWAHGLGFDDIARKLGMASADDAERMIRTVVERLRRRFRNEGGRA